MKNKLLALLCAMVILVGVVFVATPKADAANHAYKVGYARVDVTPYVDPTLTGEALVATSNIMQLPLRGSGDVWNRLSTKGLLDDNGDGVVDENDGLKATCLAITDETGKTILLITIDLIGGTMINKVNVAVMERVTAAIEAGELENVDLAKESIYYGGTHTHSAPDTTVYVAAGKTGTNNAGIDLSVVNENLGIWIDRTIDSICDAAIEALKDRAAATVTKDQLAVSDATSEAVKGKTLTMTRHYVNGEDGSVAGDNFNDRGSNPTQVTKADDNIYLMKFSFADSSKLPIILTSFRGHPSLNNSDSYAGADNNCISSDYINAYRTALEFGVDVTVEKELGVGYVEDWTYGTTQKYRVLYFNGTGGNTNPRGYEVLRDENGNALTYGSSNTVIRAYTWIDLSASKGGNTRANSVGTVLATLAQECLTDGKNESAVDYGEIKTMQKKYTADRKTVGITALSHRAGVAYQASDALYDAAYSAYSTANSKFSAYKTAKQTYDNASSWLKWMYKSDMDNALSAYNTANATLNEKLAAYEEYMTANFTNKASQASTTLVGSTYGPTKPLQSHPLIYKEGDETFAIGSRFHASNLVSMWNTKLDIPKTGDTTITLNAFMLGEDLAFVVVPGEPFDYYYKEYGVYTPENNLWNILNDDVYGKPVVLGYTNGAAGYFPNYEAYFYNEGRTDKAIGSYETQNNTKNAGHGERMVYELDSMLAALNGEVRTSYCAQCKQEAQWLPFAGDISQGGHYYLCSDFYSAQLQVDDGLSVCLDLNGYTYTGASRAFYFNSNANAGGKATLSIFDSSEEKTGVLKGCGGDIGAARGFGGGTIFVGMGHELNIYGGTITSYDYRSHGTVSGDVLLVRGSMNMYGGEITGGAVSSFTGSYYDTSGKKIVTTERTGLGGNLNISGVFNMYGGKITGGSTLLMTGTVLGSDELGYANQESFETIQGLAPCVCVTTYSTSKGQVNLYNDASIDHVYFNGLDETRLHIYGNYTGTVEVQFSEKTELSAGSLIGSAKEDAAGVAPNASRSQITVTGVEGLVGAVSNNSLVLSEHSWSYGHCEACNKTVQWQPMGDAEFDVYNGVSKGATQLPAGHYRMDEDVQTDQKQLNGAGDHPGTFCLDLAGHIFTGKTRAFYVYDDAVLNILDSVGGGVVEGKSGTNMGGGVLYSQGTAVINLYNGTIRHNNENNDYIASGGCVRCNGGTFNMYDGKLEGLKVTSVGGAVYVGYRTANGVTNYGSCNVYGGEITAGSAGQAGDAIYVNNANCKVTVGGTAKVADVYVAVDPATVFAVDTTEAAFTGSVQLTCKETPAVGATLGSCIGKNGIASGSVTLSGSALPVVVANGKLVQNVELKSFHLVSSSGIYASYDTFAEALEAYTYDEALANYIRLTVDVSKANVNKTAYVDLCGFYMSQPTIEDGATLYCMDSQTDDFTIDDEMAYGMVYNPILIGSAAVKEIPVESTVAEDGYLMIREGKGYSFHRVTMDIKSMSLRASAVGLYYSCSFKGDEIVGENVKRFGIALSAWMEPDAMTLEEMCLYTEDTVFVSGAAGNTSNGVLLSGIMKEENTAARNQANGETAVYGRAYIETADGYTFGTSVTRSLKDQLEDINLIWESLSDAQKASVRALCVAYSDAMTDWEISNIVNG